MVCVLLQPLLLRHTTVDGVVVYAVRRIHYNA